MRFKYLRPAFIAASVTLLLLGSLLLGTLIPGVAALKVETPHGREAGQGETVTYQITVINNETFAVKVKVELDEDFETQVYPSEFDLLPGADKQVTIVLELPKNILLGKHRTLTMISQKENLILPTGSDYKEVVSFNITTTIVAGNFPVYADPEPPRSSFPLVLTLSLLGLLVAFIRRRPWLTPVRWLPLAVIWSFTKVDRQMLLNNPHRRLVYRAILAHPGARQNELLRETGLSRGGLRYALMRLEEFEFIRRGAYLQYYPVGQHYVQDWMARLSTADREIIAAIKANHLHSQKELSQRLNVSASTLQYHLDRLIGDGYLQVKTRSRTIRYEINEPNA